MPELYKKLDWDSAFFGFPVAEIDSSLIDENSLDSILNQLSKEGFRLVYFFSGKEEPRAEKNKGKLVDMKLLYSKVITHTEETSSYIRSFSPQENYHLLRELAILSGRYSRFRIDPGFKNGVFEHLFDEWIKNSVNRRIADEVFVYDDAGSIDGMITLAMKNDAAAIGLIAVHTDRQGKQIGKKLLDAAENKAQKTGRKLIEVTTQSANRQACTFYEKNGFIVKSVKWVYHFWLHD